MSYTTISSKEPASESNIKSIEISQDPMSIYTGKLASPIVPDSPPTMFISANSSPCNLITDKEDQYPNINNFYSFFSKASEEIKSKDLNNSYFSHNAATNTNNINTSSSSNNQLLPPSLVNNQNNNANVNMNNVNNDNTIKNIELLNSFFPYSNAQMEWNNTFNAYYQQLAFYNQMIMAMMYSPMLTSIYSGNNLNPLFNQVLGNWTGISNPAISSLNYADLQPNQLPNMLSIASLPQIPINNSVNNGNFSVTNSPVHSSQSIPSSLLSPISTTQTTASRSSINNIEGNFDIGKNGSWNSRPLLDSSINHNSIIELPKTSIRHEHRKTEKTRKTIKPNLGGRRKIDKSSAICVVCGTTQTSQWRFLNLTELYDKDENSFSPKLEGTDGNTKTENPTYLDKQICCNACYMKYDRNRPRYRNGKKVPPPLPSYIYTNSQYINNRADNNLKREASLLESE